ncbi:MAG: DinB family protein [Calditrichota bacterium]
MRQHFIQLFVYDYWANKQLLHSLQKNTNLPQRAIELFNHLLLTHAYWWDILNRKPRRIRSLWLEAPKDEPIFFWNSRCRGMNNHALRRWLEYVENIPDPVEEQKFSYTDTNGKICTKSVASILTHVYSHSLYHRAQIIADLKAAGLSIPDTDFLTFAEIFNTFDLTKFRLDCPVP